MSTTISPEAGRLRVARRVGSLDQSKCARRSSPSHPMKQNEQLLTLSRQILELTDEIHWLTVSHTGGPGPAVAAPPTPSPG